MPLKKGKENIGYNIEELKHHGKRKRSMKQIEAIAIHAAVDGKGKRRRSKNLKKK